MNLKFKNPEAKAKTLQMVKDMASSDKSTSLAAQESFAALISTLGTSRVLDPLSMSAQIFKDVITFSGEEIAEIPIDVYFNIPEGHFKVWSNGFPGGLQYNEISGDSRFRFTTVSIDSAIAWNKSYVAGSNGVNLVQRAIQRLIDEVQVKSDYLAFSVLAEALGKARTGGMSHVIQSDAKANATTRKFGLVDVSNLITKMVRLHQSWANGTSRSSVGALDTLLVSPETMGQVRAFTYNPMNTTAIPDTAESTVLGLPDELRMEVYRSGGLTSIYGMNLVQMNELGVGQVYTELFRQHYNATGGGAPTWNAATDELIIGLDTSMGSFARAVREDAENGSQFTLEVDDQFPARAKKMGYFGGKEEGWLVGNDRAIVGLIY